MGTSTLATSALAASYASNLSTTPAPADESLIVAPSLNLISRTPSSTNSATVSTHIAQTPNRATENLDQDHAAPQQDLGEPEATGNATNRQALSDNITNLKEKVELLYVNFETQSHYGISEG